MIKALKKMNIGMSSASSEDQDALCASSRRLQQRPGKLPSQNQQLSLTLSLILRNCAILRCNVTPPSFRGGARNALSPISRCHRLLGPWCGLTFTTWYRLLGPGPFTPIHGGIDLILLQSSWMSFVGRLPRVDTSLSHATLHRPQVLSATTISQGSLESVGC